MLDNSIKIEKLRIADPLEIDAFFMADVWRDDDLFVVQALTQRLLDIYIDILSHCHNLPERDTFHLAREMTYHAISVFIDTCYRFKMIPKNNYDFSTDKNAFLNEFERFFSSDTVNLSLSSSRILRSRLANLIALSLGHQQIFGDIEVEPQNITIEQTGIKPSPEQNFWLFRNYDWGIPQKLNNILRVFLYQQLKKIKQGITRIGYLEINEEYFLQLPGIQFIPLNINFENRLQQVTLEKRKALYENTLPEFIMRSKALDGWHIFLNFAPSEDFLRILLAFIILCSEPLLCDSRRLIETIQYCCNRIEAKNVQALFSVGSWFRFQNAVIAVAAREKYLPVVHFQLGGGCIYRIGKNFDNEELKFIDYYLTCDRWQDASSQIDFPKFIKVPSPGLYELNLRGKIYLRKIKIKCKQNFKILYSAFGLSCLFRVENWLSFNSDQMKKHRLLIQEALELLDKNEYAKYFNLFVKAKGFYYKLYKGYEYMLFPQLKTENIRVKYIFKGVSPDYFDFVDVHFFDSLATTFVQSLSYNIPSVVFWNRDILKIHSQYQSLIEHMVKLGIIVTNPEQTCSAMVRLYKEPGYWFTTEVQDAVKEYLNSFGYFTKNWRREISLALKMAVKEQE